VSEPWKTDRYFVSPLNYLDEVRKDFKLPRTVKIHDITLRDGEQETGVALRKDEKIRIAEKLAEVGVHRIEAGMAAVTRQDEQAIREIVKRNLGPEIFGFCRCIVDDVKLAADCGVKGVVIEIPSSEHIIEYAYQWPLAKAIDLSVKATRFAHEQGLYVVFFTIDATRADFSWLFQIIDKVAAEGHMDALTLVDTMGVASTPAVRYYVRRIKERISKPLEAHFHNDFGLANANSLAAVEEGAEVIHSTVLGIGERSGQASTEQIALALELLYGYKTGIHLDKLYDLCRVVADLTGHLVPVNQPVVGEHVYHLESGIPSNWWLKVRDSHPTEVFALLPSLVGRENPELVLGKKSGLDSIAFALDKIGQTATPDEIAAITLLVKERALEKKGLLTEDEFREIAVLKRKKSTCC
jgi:isopropylmalate/homocitrate/citramalate synthase